MSKERRRAMLEALAKQPITDLTGYTWVGNDTLQDLPEIGKTYFLSFYTNLENYIRIHELDTPTKNNLRYIKPNDSGHDVYNYKISAWLDANDKTINITGGPDATNPELITWFIANGTLTKN